MMTPGVILSSVSDEGPLGRRGETKDSASVLRGPSVAAFPQDDALVHARFFARV